ncbi:MAG: hypothetical protein K0Q66_634 [Chitinophagaceae bacterium]|jgi:hypothetical protein|nr:hypothetical protein [Chitinophagaceae bacterium]
MTYRQVKMEYPMEDVSKTPKTICHGKNIYQVSIKRDR